MAITAVVLAAAMTTSVLSTEAVSYFPGDFYHRRARTAFQRQVMASWPGPAELLRLWSDADLTEEQRVALLLGGAVYRDPILIPAYREALQSRSQRLRQAAIYGYHDLLADRPPNVKTQIDQRIVDAYTNEMYWMQQTLQRQSLLAMWLQSVLVQEGGSLPGYIGVKLTRSSRECFRAAERIVDVGDLELLLAAYEQSRQLESRLTILRLVEAVTMSRFIIKPTGDRVAWGSEVFTSAVQRFENRLRSWEGRSCQVDGETVLQRNLRSLGSGYDKPLESSACGLWLAVLEGDHSRWWMMAARRLYACGGPWYELSVLQPDTDRNEDLRKQLSDWYEPLR
jgi:hypothetical protein